MIGEILQNRALLAAGAFTVNAPRQSVINFTVFIDRQPYNLLTRRPDHLTRALLFLQPFAADVRRGRRWQRERAVWGMAWKGNGDALFEVTFYVRCR